MKLNESILSESSTRLIRAANPDVSARARVRLLIAIPSVLAGMTALLSAVYYWVAENYLARYRSMAPGSDTYTDFSADWLILMILFVLAASAIGYALAYSLTVPIHHLMRLSERVAAGDLTPKPALERNDEMGQLGHSFNFMISSLNEFLTNRNRFILESFSGGLIVTDVNGTVMAVNSATEQMLGLTEESSKGTDVLQMLQNDGLAALRQIVETSVWKHTRIDNQMLAVQVDGHQTEISLTGSPMIDRDGNVFGMLFNLRDAGEMRRFYEQMKRTDRLITMGTFATGLAHEIRNPLGSIKGTAQLLQEDVRDMPKASEYARIIVKESNRLDALIREVQDYSQPAASKVTADLNRLIADCVSLMRNGLQADGSGAIRIIEQYANLPHVGLSPNKFSQVLHNMLLNAVQACPVGGKIEISTAHLPGTRLPITIRIANTGLPIAADQFDRIFEPFFTTKATGTGLGLAISYQVVTHHGGELVVENEPPMVVFTIRLPVA